MKGQGEGGSWPSLFFRAVPAPGRRLGGAAGQGVDAAVGRRTGLRGSMATVMQGLGLVGQPTPWEARCCRGTLGGVTQRTGGQRGHIGPEDPMGTPKTDIH